jgi:hypothetical protein
LSRSRSPARPSNAEPGKCSEIAWHELSDLPAGIVSYIRTGLNAYDNGTSFSLGSWQPVAA